MKKQIKEVQKYFKSKIVRGEFDVLEHDTYVTKILIDNEFNFIIRMGNAGAQFVELWQGSFMSLAFDEAEQLIIFDNLTAMRFQVLKDKKRAEFEKLKAELGE